MSGMEPNVNGVVYVEVMCAKSNMYALKTLHIEHVHLSMIDLDFIQRNVINLSHLVLSACKFKEVEDGCVKQWSRKAMDVLKAIINASAKTLKYINLSFNGFDTFDFLDDIKVCKSIEEIHLDGNSFGCKGLCYIFRSLHGLPNLKRVSLAKVNDEGKCEGWVRPFGDFVSTTPSLRFIDLADNTGIGNDQDLFIKYKREVLLRRD